MDDQDQADQDHDSHIMVWNVDDHKRINKIEQEYDHQQSLHPQQPLERKFSTGDGGGGGYHRRESILKGMIKDIKDVTNVVHETATSTMSFFEHASLAISPTSMSSSSIDVGPSPGSGLQTEVDSTEMESNQSDEEFADYDGDEEECETLKGIEVRPPLDERPDMDASYVKIDDGKLLQQPLSVIEIGKDVMEGIEKESTPPHERTSSTGYALAANSSSSSVGTEGPPSTMEPKEDFTQHLN